MYEHMAENHVLALPRMADARGARSYGVMLMVAVLLHAALALFMSRPVHVASAVPSINVESVTFTERNEAPGPVDLSYRPEVANVLPPVPNSGPGGEGNGLASDLQARVNAGGLVMDGGNGEDVIRISDRNASLDSLLELNRVGRSGNGRIGGFRARVDVPTVPFYKLEVNPKLVDAPVPVYPEAVRNAGIEGSPVVEALLNLDGSVMDARVLKSSGNQSLDASAIEAALKAKFTPAKQRDKPVRVWISIPYRFTLKG